MWKTQVLNLHAPAREARCARLPSTPTFKSVLTLLQCTTFD